MEKKVFKIFYDNTIIPLRDMMCNEEFKSVDNFEGVYEEYQNQKTLLKLLLKNEDKENPDDINNKLDRHKISACISVAILKTRLIYDINADDNENEKREYFLYNSNRMNEQLAFYCGMSNLIAFMADESENDEDIKDIKNFHLPKTSYNADRLGRDKKKIGDLKQNYIDSIIRGLYYTNTMSGVQTLLLSNIFFLLEAYHKQACELNKIKAT